jgi:dihydroorotate dehydrogenase electron transfer subunit
MLQQKAQVLWNRRIAPTYFKMGLGCSRGYSLAIPGQFIMLRISDGLDPILRRPFSIHQLIKKNGRIAGIELLYRIVGVGTQKLSMCRPGDLVDILGPLGRGFSVPADAGKIFIVAGGIGVAPMPFLVSYLQAKQVDLTACKVFIGGKSKDDLLCQDELRASGMQVHATTDDGSSGDQCLVTDPIESEITLSRPDIIYACGPIEMLACICGIVDKHSISCQVSTESLMACGIGACLGCALESRKTPGHYLHACKGGPVFDARLLKF